MNLSNNARAAIAIVGAMLLAALATPELSGKLPPGLAQVAAAIVAAVLHKLNANAPPQVNP